MSKSLRLLVYDMEHEIRKSRLLGQTTIQVDLAEMTKFLHAAQLICKIPSTHLRSEKEFDPKKITTFKTEYFLSENEIRIQAQIIIDGQHYGSYS